MKEADPNQLADDQGVCLGAGDEVFPIRGIKQSHLVGQVSQEQ